MPRLSGVAHTGRAQESFWVWGLGQGMGKLGPWVLGPGLLVGTPHPHPHTAGLPAAALSTQLSLRTELQSYVKCRQMSPKGTNCRAHAWWPCAGSRPHAHPPRNG